MRGTVDAVVITCLFVMLYINLTDLPKHQQVVQGQLIKIGFNK